jgi:surface-anchored protein
MYKRPLFCHVCLLVSAVVAFNANAQRCIVNTSPVATLYFGVEIPLPNPDHPHTIPNAHTDIAIPLTFADGWDLHILTDLPRTDTRVETEQAMFALTAAQRASFSGSVPPGYEFIGAPAGQTFWYYNQEAAPSPGFNSDTMTSAELNALCSWDPNDPSRLGTGAQKWMQVNLVDVRGPAGGKVSMWQEGQTPVVFFSTHTGGITDQDVYYIVAGTHAHCSWAFTKPGLYEVDLQVSTQHLCDESLTADLNSDCVVNLADFAILAGQWLSCGSAFGPGCP